MSPSTRSAGRATSIAVALLATAGLAGLVLGPYVIVLGIWIDGLPSTPPSFPVLAIDAILGLAIVATGVMSLVAARAVWRGEAWGVPASLLVAFALLAGMAVTALVGLWLAPYWLVVVLAVLIAAAIFASRKGI